LASELGQLEPRVPLQRLLEGLERAKSDTKATPNVYAVRVLDSVLSTFEPDRLIAALRAVQTVVGERWIEVDSVSGEVRLHHTALQLVAEMERGLRSLPGVDRDQPDWPPA